MGGGGKDLHTDRRRGRVVIVMLQIQMMSHLVTSRSPSDMCQGSEERHIMRQKTAKTDIYKTPRRQKCHMTARIDTHVT